ncbi:TIGR04083 family peptide-modifying radical SAM enzyme [bacterium]|nr:TIGR04083 family peptide-modifying radical SAM enzyme [bacterium]
MQRDMPFPHFMIIPSFACPAQCTYCFGPHQGAVMSMEVLEKTLNYIEMMVRKNRPEKIAITFHGGEPLCAGIDFFKHALEQLQVRLGDWPVRIKIQSNLWLLDDSFCRLFQKHRVVLGTSLDGPQIITDRQRGEGYFQKTMQGIERARQYGLEVGCIATFTTDTAKRWQEVIDFFINQRLNVSLHAAVPSLGGDAHPHHLSPPVYASLLPKVLAYYLKRQKDIQISSLDQIVRGVCSGQGEVCTFRECLGMFLVIDPQGVITSCQRFCGHAQYQLGHIRDMPDFALLMQSPAAQQLAVMQNRMKQACRGCSHWPYCKGGCLYNAAQSGKNDPYCPAYKKIFTTVQTGVLQAMQTPEGIRAMAQGSKQANTQEHPLVSLLHQRYHPSRTARHAKKIITAVALGQEKTPQEITGIFIAKGWSNQPEAVLAAVQVLQEKLYQPEPKMNNLYVHITQACQLRCSHCYADSGTQANQGCELPLQTLSDLIRQAGRLGFRQVVITGGEPLLYGKRHQLLKQLMDGRKRVRPLKLILRTNFSMALDGVTMSQIARAFHQVVVSVDGDQKSHDARRGLGSYTAVVENLRHYRASTAGIPGAAQLSLAAVLADGSENNQAVQAVVRLAKQLKIERTRVRPLLPLGRARHFEIQPTAKILGQGMNSMQSLQEGIHITRNCGLGQNLYIASSGEVYPCYAHFNPADCLGTIHELGLAEIMLLPRFKQWRATQVDHDPVCKTCEYKYLCGGMCHAWDREKDGCQALKKKSQQLYQTAMRFLGVKEKAMISSIG